MKTVAKVLAVLVLFASVSVLAASLEGTYSFSSRLKSGAPDMAGWQGTMTIKGTEMTRNYKSSDGKQEKFYTASMKQDGNVYVVKTTKAYKPEYVGSEYRNKITVTGNKLVIESEDGAFKEEWIKK